MIFDQQEVGNGESLIQKIIQDSLVEIKKANDIQREKTPLSKLTIGLNAEVPMAFQDLCQSTLGASIDKLIALGGSAILSEFPELRGVEQELVDRCVDWQKPKKFIKLMESYESKSFAFRNRF